MRFESFPDDIREVTESVIGAVLQCSECAHGYKVIGQELRFYREMGIPLPRKCPDCRHRSRIANGNPRQLWKRKCKKCGIAIQTTYAPDRPESVYCEACYLQEVY